MAKFNYSAWLVHFLGSEKFIFEWDAGNSTKNKDKHLVLPEESEEALRGDFIIPLGEQVVPIVSEKRFAVLGATEDLRKLFIVFTMRGKRIRIISARPMSRTEREIYEKIEEEICKK